MQLAICFGVEMKKKRATTPGIMEHIAKKCCPPGCSSHDEFVQDIVLAYSIYGGTDSDHDDDEANASKEFGVDLGGEVDEMVLDELDDGERRVQTGERCLPREGPRL